MYRTQDRTTKEDSVADELRRNLNEREKENKFEKDFEKGFFNNSGQTFRPDQDPFKVSNVIYTDVYKEIQEKVANIKRNIDEAQFLSDSGAQGKITSTKSVSTGYRLIGYSDHGNASDPSNGL